jgi:hypothetical protein
MRPTSSLISLLLIVAVSVGRAASLPLSLGSFQTMDGKSYSSVSITRFDDQKIYFLHSSGASSASWEVVPENIRTALGYDPKQLVETKKKIEKKEEESEPKPRLGASEDDFKKSAGYYIGDYAGSLGSRILLFKRGDLSIHATFWKGICHSLVIYDSAAELDPRSGRLIIQGKELTGSYEPMIKAALDANSNGLTWTEKKAMTTPQRDYSRTDGEATATYIPGRIELTTKEFSQAISENVKSREKKALEGL